MIRRWWAFWLLVLAVVVAVLALAGCASVEERSDDDRVSVRLVPLPDGREVMCVFWVPSTGHPDGAQMACDWAGAAVQEQLPTVSGVL